MSVRVRTRFLGVTAAMTVAAASFAAPAAVVEVEFCGK